MPVWNDQTDDSVQGTATTLAGSTGVLLTQAVDDFDEIRFRVPIVAITGSPIFGIQGSADNSTWTSNLASYTRSSSDNGKVIAFAVVRPIYAYYRLHLNLNSGTVKIATGSVGSVTRHRPRSAPVVSTTCVNITFVSGG